MTEQELIERMRGILSSSDVRVYRGWRRTVHEFWIRPAYLSAGLLVGTLLALAYLAQ